MFVSSCFRALAKWFLPLLFAPNPLSPSPKASAYTVKLRQSKKGSAEVANCVLVSLPFCSVAQQNGIENPSLFFIVIPRLGGISVGFAGIMDYWKTGMMGFWGNGEVCSERMNSPGALARGLCRLQLLI
jgi:hypothetical protein